MSEEHHATLTIENDLGLHARAATMFVKVAARYEAEIFVEKGGREVNGKSIMGLLTLVAALGTQINLRSVGKDAEAQLVALSELVASKFGENH
jgi:phosphocarrier protein HPr